MRPVNGSGFDAWHAQDTEAETKEHLLALISAQTLLHREFPSEEFLLGALVTKTTRTFLVGTTGAGKTNVGLAIAGGMASGQGFLRWRSSRPARVLYVDGEMPLALLQERVRDVARRLGGEDALGELYFISWQDADTLLLPGLSTSTRPLKLDIYGEAGDADPKWAPLNTPAGCKFILAICDAIQPDVIMLDNVQSLVAGDMKDELAWSDTLPLVAALTARQIGQIWFDHTGWNTTRQYGSATKAWQFDTVGVIEPLPATERQAGELAFSLSFEAPGKARRRTPANWAEFLPCIIRLRDDTWTLEEIAEPQPKPRRTRLVVPPSRAIFHEALLDALIVAQTGPGETTMAAWELECIRRGLLERSPDRDWRRDLRRARAELLAAKWIGIDGVRVMDLTRAYGMAEPAQAAQPAQAAVRVPDYEPAALRALTKAMAADAVLVTVGDDHAETSAVREADWLRWFRQAGEEADFRTVVDGLIAKGRIGRRDGFAWPLPAS